MSLPATLGLVAVLAVAGIAAASLLFDDADKADDPVARQAVAFSLPALRPDRPDVSLAAAPGRPTVLNFFAAWCIPCKAELPVLKAAAAAHPEIAFVGVDHIDPREDAVELLDAAGITYPAGHDPRGSVAQKYLVRGLPATAFIAADGRIVEMHYGQLDADEMADALRGLTLQNRTP